MGAAEVICCFFRRENIHNRPEISDHFHTHVPERGADVALVPEERPLEEGRGGDDAGLRARAQPQQFELRRDELRRLLRVRRLRAARGFGASSF